MNASDDLIRRQGVLNSLNKYRIEKMSEGKDVSLVWECIDKVLQEPSAQAEPTFEQIKKYCERRCLMIIGNEFYHDLITACSAPPEWLIDRAELFNRLAGVKTLEEAFAIIQNM